MNKPTYLMVLTTETTRQIDTIVRAVCEISEPTDARVVIAQVFTERTYAVMISQCSLLSQSDFREEDYTVQFFNPQPEIYQQPLAVHFALP